MFRTPHSKLPDQLTLQLRKKDIKRVATLKFLGIIVHEHLSWKPHMEALLKKIRITCSVVNKIRNHRSQRILLLLYNSMIKGHLQYCIMTWCNGNKTMIKHLKTAVNKFIRIMFRLNARDSVKDEMQKHSIFSINQLKKLELASFMYKALYKIRPEPSCFGITSLISDNNQGGPHRKPRNKITQSGVWAFNTMKRRIAVAKEKKNRQVELARLISRKTKKTL